MHACAWSCFGVAGALNAAYSSGRRSWAPRGSGADGALATAATECPANFGEASTAFALGAEAAEGPHSSTWPPAPPFAPAAPAAPATPPRCCARAAVRPAVGAALVALVAGAALSTGLSVHGGGDAIASDIGLAHGFARVLLPLALAPLGALARFGLGLFNRPDTEFPVFTLTANLAGCAVTAAVEAAAWSTGRALSDSLVLASVAAGFSGCLSTVSTLVAEARNLSPWPQFRYLFVTYFSAIALFCAVYLPCSLLLGAE